MRQALESNYVSNNLHNWIDMIFGCYSRPIKKDKKGQYFTYQTDDPAVKKMNLFHPCVYSKGISNVNQEKIENSTGKKSKKSGKDLKSKALLTMVKTYGQLPRQLFTANHSSKLNQLNYQPTLGRINNINHLQMGDYLGTNKKLKVGLLGKKLIGYKVDKIIGQNLAGHQSLYVRKSKNSISCINWKPRTGIFNYVLSSDLILNEIDNNRFKNENISNILSNLEVKTTIFKAIKNLIPEQISISCVITADSDLILGADSGIILINSSREKLKKLLGHSHKIIEMRVCSEQRILVTLDVAGNILIWDQDYCYIRSILSNNNDVENNFSENKIEILPTSGEILHAEQNVNSTNEPVIKLKLYSINASLEVARMLENLSLVSLCVTDVDEGKAVNSVFVGVSQRDGRSGD